jgi:HSP20 family protein
MATPRIGRQPNWPPHIDELQREMERFFDHFHLGKRPQVVFSEQAWAPHVDVYEADDQAVVLVDLAGVSKEQIQLEVEHDHLKMRGERRPSHHRGDERTFYALEIPYGAFERLIHLPFPVDSSRAEASYRDGFLEIVLPRVRPQEPRRVQIRTQEPGVGSPGQA